MLKWIRRSIVLVFLLLSIALAVFAIKGSRDGICMFWTREIANLATTQYWQVDSVGGRLQLLKIEPYPQAERFEIRRAEKNWNQTGPLSGGAIVARFPASSFSLPGLLFEDGKATAFPGFISFSSRSSLTVKGGISIAASGLVITGGALAAPTPGSGNVTITSPSIRFSSTPPSSVRLNWSTPTTQSTVVQSFNYSGGTAISASNYTAVAGTGTLAITIVPGGTGNRPYTFFSINSIYVVGLLLLPFLIEAALMVRSQRIRAYRLRHNHCLACGYDLSGAAHERCPECGRAIVSAIPSPLPQPISRPS